MSYYLVVAYATLSSVGMYGVTLNLLDLVVALGSVGILVEVTGDGVISMQS